MAQHLDEIKNMTKDEVLQSDAIKKRYRFWLPKGVWGDEYYGSIELGNHDKETVDAILDSLGKTYFIWYISAKSLTAEQIIRSCIDNSEHPTHIHIQQLGIPFSDFSIKYLGMYFQEGGVKEEYEYAYSSIEEMASELPHYFDNRLNDNDLKKVKEWFKELIEDPSNRHLLPEFKTW